MVGILYSTSTSIYHNSVSSEKLLVIIWYMFIMTNKGVQTLVLLKYRVYPKERW